MENFENNGHTMSLINVKKDKDKKEIRLKDCPLR